MSDPDVMSQKQPETLVVQADSGETSLGWASLGAKRWRCTVGAGGVREDKVEGDAATPAGSYPLRRIYFRNDRTYQSRHAAAWRGRVWPVMSRSAWNTHERV